MERDKQEIIIKQLFRDSIEDQVSVENAFNPEISKEQCFRHWKNKHYKNPLGDSIVFGAYYNGKLVGVNCYMPVEYHLNGQKFAFVQSCDSKVLTECRGHGIWSKIVKVAVDYIIKETEYAGVIGFPNYRNSYPGFIKMNWQTLDNMNNYVMVNNPQLFARMVFPKRGIKQMLARLIGAQRILINLSSTNLYEIRKCGFDELLWDDEDDKLCVSHTDALMEWKRLYKSIKTIAICKGENVIGSCIYSFDRFNGQQVCKIEKFVTNNCTKFQKKKIYAAVLKYIRKHESQAAFVRIWTMNGTECNSICKYTLFFKSKHPNPFIIKQPSDTFNNIKWKLSFFDLD